MLLAGERVDHACQHLALAFDASTDLLVEPFYNPFRKSDGGIAENPSFVVDRMFATHLMHDYATLTRASGPKGSYDVGGKTVEYDRINALAFTDGKGHGSVLVSSRSLDEPLRVTFDVDAGYHVTASEQWAPPAIDTPADAPVPITEAVVNQVGERIEVTAPPHSFLALELTK